jgi:type IV secretion system protein VirB9
MKSLLSSVLSVSRRAAGMSNAWADPTSTSQPSNAGTAAIRNAAPTSPAESVLNPLLAPLTGGNEAGAASATAPVVPALIPSTDGQVNPGASKAAVPVVVPAIPTPVAKQVAPAKPRAHGQRPSRHISINTLTGDDMDRAERIWERTGQAAGVIGINGTLTYAYGESRPTIHCAPLHLCVVQFINGEQITDLSIGDSVRWKVAASRAGDTPVVVIKPVAIDLETNITVLTDAGRVYYMTLKSDEDAYVPLVQFYNPLELIHKVATEARRKEAEVKAEQETKDASLGKIDPATLDINYTCTGEASFKPVRVFSGNGHVYLQMPGDMAFHDSPAIFDESSGNTQLINSRPVRGYVVLDGLPKKIKLVVGLDNQAQVVECAHGAAPAAAKPRRETPWNAQSPYQG